MQKIKVIAVLMVVALFSMQLIAAESKTVVVDFQKVLSESKAFKSFKQQLEENKNAISIALQKEREDLQNEEQKLAKSRGDYTEKEFKEKATSFQNKVEDFQKKYQAKEAEFDKNRTEAYKTIETQVQKVIQDLAKEKSYAKIYQSGAFLYNIEDENVTGEVIKRLNKALPSIAFKSVEIK